MDERELRTLFERGGLQLPAEELERLRPLAEEYLNRLDLLYSVELPETEEPAATFTPEESPWAGDPHPARTEGEGEVGSVAEGEGAIDG